MCIFLCSWILLFVLRLGRCRRVSCLGQAEHFFIKKRRKRERAGHLLVVCSCKKSQLDVKSKSRSPCWRWPYISSAFALCS